MILKGGNLTLCWLIIRSVHHHPAFSADAMPPRDVLVPPRGSLCTGADERCLDYLCCQLSFSSTPCSPFCSGCPTTASLLAQSLPSMSPVAPPLPSESCPPQRAHAKGEKLTHDSPEEYLASRSMEEENKSNKCSSALLAWETVQRHQHNQGTRVLHCAVRT